MTAEEARPHHTTITLGQSVGFHSRVYTFYLSLLGRLSEIIGLCILLYSLLVVPSQSR